MSNLISLVLQKHFQIYGFQITQNVFVYLSCSNKTNSQIYVITHSNRGKYFPLFSSLVESVGDHERSAKSTIGFVIGFLYRIQYYKSKFLFSFFSMFSGLLWKYIGIINVSSSSWHLKLRSAWLVTRSIDFYEGHLLLWRISFVSRFKRMINT